MADESNTDDGNTVILETGSNDWDGMLALGEAFLFDIHVSRGHDRTIAPDDDVETMLTIIRRMREEIGRLNTKLDELIDENAETMRTVEASKKAIEVLTRINADLGARNKKLVEIAKKAVKGELTADDIIPEERYHGYKEIHNTRGAGGDVRQARRGPHQQPGHHNERIRRRRGPHGQARRERRHHPEQRREGL